ncbi:MAG: single-stranded DNA-binding protein [Geovibrio sp.]|nr:single-stranded DNA-binding protein [Geovibrio sp.]
MEINKVILSGYLTRNPEVKTFEHESKKFTGASFGVAVNEKRGNKDVVSFFEIKTYGRSAEICGEFLSKGSPAIIEGRLRQDRFEIEGQKRQCVFIVAEKVKFIGGINNEKGFDTENGDSSFDYDDVPF